jgi:hypothetical protein
MKTLCCVALLSVVMVSDCLAQAQTVRCWVPRDTQFYTLRSNANGANDCIRFVRRDDRLQGQIYVNSQPGNIKPCTLQTGPHTGQAINVRPVIYRTGPDRWADNQDLQCPP